MWHVWSDDALCVVSGGDEQPLPDLEDGARVEVLMRSKDNGGRLVTWAGPRPSYARRTSGGRRPRRPSCAGRLNVPDLATAADGWAGTSVVRRIVPHR